MIILTSSNMNQSIRAIITLLIEIIISRLSGFIIDYSYPLKLLLINIFYELE